MASRAFGGRVIVQGALTLQHVNADCFFAQVDYSELFDILPSRAESPLDLGAHLAINK
jgi:hypothetical protein